MTPSKPTPSTESAPASLAGAPGSAPPRFYWKQCYELGESVHWALCDTQTDGQGLPHRVSCLELILWDHWSSKLPDALIPKLIVELLNAHYSQNEKGQP